VRVNLNEFNHFQNIHQRASDRKKSELLIANGTRIRSAEIGIAASIGKSLLKVSKLPRILIVSTGNELVPIDQVPLEYQIRRSNLYAVQAILKKFMICSDLSHFDDNKLEIEQGISKALINYDVIILSGAVSAGKFDYLPEILAKLNVKPLFHKVKQRPGKPFWFGVHPSGTIFFALPGNPLSTILCTLRYVVPWLSKTLFQKEESSLYAILDCDILFDKDLQYFAPVLLSNREGKLMARPIAYRGSGDFSCLAGADGFVELPSEKTKYAKGESYPIYLL
jgi:molybdopterin molybdotransferase